MGQFQTVDGAFVHGLIKPRPDDGHKGTFGHALIIAGSEGKIGSAILASAAALRTGCGLVSLYISGDAGTAVMAHLPEAMIIPRKNKKADHPDYEKFSAIGIGPGIGLDKCSALLLLDVLKYYRGALAIDADAITILAAHRKWYHLLGPGMVLTPHPKEFDRLTREHDSADERYETQLAFSVKYKITIILKGHRTMITCPDGAVYRNTTGNSGMATAGSGDVLTGIITSLCAQGYSVKNSALIGTFLHGFAGDLAAGRLARTSMIASDIVASVPGFFKEFEV